MSDGDHGAGEDSPQASLDSGLSGYDRRLVALAEKSVDEAMKDQPTWLTDEQRKAIRYQMLVDLLIDPRGLEMLQRHVGKDPRFDSSAPAGTDGEQ